MACLQARETVNDCPSYVVAIPSKYNGKEGLGVLARSSEKDSQVCVKQIIFGREVYAHISVMRGEPPCKGLVGLDADGGAKKAH